VESVHVVVDAPVLDHDACFEEGLWSNWKSSARPDNPVGCQGPMRPVDHHKWPHAPNGDGMARPRNSMYIALVACRPMPG